MNTEIKKCPDCQVSPGQRHEDGCDTTPCRFTGNQMLTCGFVFSFDAAGAIEVVESDDHECEPCVWTGEWPGIKVCRDNNWYTTMVGFDGPTEDLNSIRLRATWDPAIEDWKAKE